MPQPPTISDVPSGQIVKHGTPIVTFNLAGQLIAEDVQWSKGFASVDFADYTNDSSGGNPGVIKRSAYSATKGLGSMTVQVKDANTVIFPGEFVVFAHTGFANLKFIVTNVGLAYTQNGATKIPIQMAEYLAESPLPQIIALDGPFAQGTPQEFLPCGPILFSRPLMIDGNNVLMYRQKFAVFRPFWQALPANHQSLPGFYLIDETELEDTAVAGVVTWDRLYSQKPPNYSERGSIMKTYKTLFFTGSPPSSGVVFAQTKKTSCDVNWQFFLGPPGVPLPDKKDVSLEFVNGVTYVLTSGGFVFANGANNHDYGFVDGEIARWKGNIYYKKEIFA